MTVNATISDLMSFLVLGCLAIYLWQDWSNAGRKQLNRVVAWLAMWQFLTPKQPFLIDVIEMVSLFVVVEALYKWVTKKLLTRVSG